MAAVSDLAVTDVSTIGLVPGLSFITEDLVCIGKAGHWLSSDGRHASDTWVRFTIEQTGAPVCFGRIMDYDAGTVQEHVAEYQRMIDQLHDENKELRLALQQVGSPGPRFNSHRLWFKTLRPELMVSTGYPARYPCLEWAYISLIFHSCLFLGFVATGCAHRGTNGSDFGRRVEARPPRPRGRCSRRTRWPAAT